MQQTVYIFTDSPAVEVSPQATAAAPLNMAVTLLSGLELKIAYVNNSVIGPLDGEEVEVVVGFKAKPNGALLASAVAVAQGSTTNTRYVASWTSTQFDSAAMRSALGDKSYVYVVAEIEWTVDGQAFRKAFNVRLNNAWIRPEDVAPDPASENAFVWLQDHLDAGTNVTLSVVDGKVVIASNDSSKVPTSRTVSAAGLATGGGALNSNVTITVPVASAEQAADGSDNAVAMTPLRVANHLASKRGAINGVAPLDSTGKVPAANLPSYVDDVLEVTTLPGSGVTGVLYITTGDGKVWRWTGSTYVEITAAVDFATEPEATAGTNNSKAMTPLRVKQSVQTWSRLLRSAGTLSGYTDPGSSPNTPPNLLIVVIGPSALVTISIDGAAWKTFEFAEADPSNGNVWIDSNAAAGSGFGTELGAAISAAAAADGVSVSVTVETIYSGSDAVTLHRSQTGSGSSLGASGNVEVEISGGGSGDDGSPPSGDVSAVLLAPAVAGRVVRVVDVILVGESWNGAWALRDGSSNNIAMGNGLEGVHRVLPANVSAWMYAGSTVTLVATTPSDGGSLTAYLVYEQY